MQKDSKKNNSTEQRKKSHRDSSNFAFAKEAEEVVKEQNTDAEQGLTDEEVLRRRKHFGENTLPEKERSSIIMLFLKQFKDFLILILLLAAGIAWFADQMIDVYIILGVIMFNAIMGFTQEYKAEKAIESIKSMVQHKAKVLRNGQQISVEARELVPGDVIVLEQGQTVPADARLLKVKNLQAAEASLTGESEAVTKDTAKLEKETVLGDRENMLWKGTHIVKGSGKAVVVTTGEKTEIGKIARTLGEMEKTDSNFRRKTGRLAKTMAAIAIGTSAIVFALGYFFRSFEFQDILLVTIATLVSSIPEGLPVVISIVLAIGASRMAKRNAIIREYTATEELGSVTTILSDKTGTITQGVLSVRKLTGSNGHQWEVTGEGYDPHGEIKHDDKPVEAIDKNKVLARMLTIAAYCNKATLQEKKAAAAEDKSSEKTAENGNAREKRVAEDKRRVTEDIRRLEEDLRSNADAKEGKKLLYRDIDQLVEDIGAASATASGDKADNDSENGTAGPNVSGDPTEVALLVLAKKSGIANREPFSKIKIVDDLPFNTDQKYRATLIQNENRKKELLVVGAPEKILELSTSVYTKKGAEKAGKKEKDAIKKKHDEWAEEALRIIALAHKEMPGSKDSIGEEDVKDLTWTGIAGIIDPPRSEVKDAVEACNKAGIRVMMVTGDHQKTAAAIAANVGISTSAGNGSEYPAAVSEKDIAGLDDKKFDDLVAHVSVFARVSPTTKLRIAERLQKKDELIAMTGDGVNDALALKKADVGIAMGKRGTDVAKDAAQIVLSDDNFASIVNAIREGRIIFQNVKIVSYFLLTTNIAAVATIIVALLAGMPIPLTAVQILWVNLVTDGVMDIGLATEPGHGEIMERDPIKKNESILQWEVIPNLVIVAAIMVALTIAAFNYYLPQGEEVARTGAFLVISMTQIFNVFNLRDLKESVFTIGIFGNKWINMAFAASVVLQLVVVKVPFLQNIFGFEDLGMVDFLVLTAISSTVLWAGELYKWIQRKRRDKNQSE